MSPDQVSEPIIDLPISVDLADWLWDRLDETELIPQLAQIADQTRARLNIPGRPRISVRAIDEELPPAGLMALRINDRACRYSLETVCWACLAVGGPPLASIAEGRELYPHLINAEPELLSGLLGYIFQEALSNQPAILLGESALADCRRMLQAAQHATGGELPPDDWLRRWLSAALDLGIRLPAPEQALLLLAGWEQKSLSTACEELIAAQSPEYIELQIERETWKALTLGITESDQELIKLFREDVQAELGIDLPPLHITTPPDLQPGTYRLMVNHLPSLPHPSLKPDQAFTLADESLLNSLGIPWQPAISPGNRQRAAWVPLSSLPALQDQSATTWSPASYLILWLSGMMRARAYCLINLKTAENALTRLGEVYPALESAAKEVVSPQRLAAVMRLMLAERLPVSNLRWIVYSLMDMDFVVAGSDLLVIDERMQVEYPPDESWVEDPAVAVEFVRSNMKYTILDAFNNRDLNLSAYLLDPAIEEQLRNPGVDMQTHLDSIPEATRVSILDAIRWEMDGKMSDNGSYPTILTTQAVRPTLRRLLAVEFPYLPVLSYQELPTDTSITKLGQIASRPD